MLWRLTSLVPEGAPEAEFFPLERAFGAAQVDVAGEVYTVPEFALYRLERSTVASSDGHELRAR